MTAKPESRLRTRIATALRARGWLVVVQHGGMYSQVGVSDLLVCAQGRFSALEVKTLTGYSTRIQEKFLMDVRAAGGIAEVVRSPADAIRTVEKGLAMADSDWDDLFDTDKPPAPTPAGHNETVTTSEGTITFEPPPTLDVYEGARSMPSPQEVDRIQFSTSEGPLERPSDLALTAHSDPEPIIVGEATYSDWRKNLPEVVAGATLDDVYALLVGLVEQVTLLARSLAADRPAPLAPVPKRSRKRPEPAAEPAGEPVQTTLDDL